MSQTIKPLILDLDQKQQIKEGLIANVGSTEFTILMVIQAHTDLTQSSAFPSQDTIARLTGLSRATISRAVKSLEDKQIITCKKGKKGLTIYQLCGQSTQSGETTEGAKPPVSETVTNPPEPIEQVTQVLTAKDFIKRFCQLYSETYGVNYNPNWSRDTSMVKNKLIGVYTSEQLEGILVTTFKHFDKRWANSKYPRPTIGALTTFLANETLTLWQKEQAETVRLAESETEDLSRYFLNLPPELRD